MMTEVYQVSDVQEGVVEETIKEVAEALEEKGYGPISQIVGYLISGDPGYISSHKDARLKITRYERIKVMEVLVKKFLE